MVFIEWLSLFLEFIPSCLEVLLLEWFACDKLCAQVIKDACATTCNLD